MEVRIFGTSPGEAIIIEFDDGAIFTIDSALRAGVNPTLEFLNADKSRLQRVHGCILTHFHNDHIKGVTEIIAECCNAQVYLPSLWSHPDILAFFVLYGEAALSEEADSTSEVKKLFEYLRVAKRKPTFVQEGMRLHPVPVGATVEDLTVLFPSNQKISDFISSVGGAVASGKTRDLFLQGNKNDVSIVLNLHHNKRHYFFGGDLENRRPNLHICSTVARHYAVDTKFGGVKIPHHGSASSFSDELRNRISDDETIVSITPFPANDLPSRDCLEYLKGAKKVFVACNRIRGFTVRDRELLKRGVKKRYVTEPGEIVFDGNLDLKIDKAMPLDKYLRARKRAVLGS